MSYTDAHCHLNDVRLDQFIDQWIEDAGKSGISKFVLGGVGPEEWARQDAIALKHPGKFVGVCGLHPWWVAAHTDAECRAAMTELKARFSSTQAGSPPKAIGELGLDFGGRMETDPEHLAHQKKYFEDQLALSMSLPELPLVLHVVRAHEPAIAVLKAARAKRSTPFKGIVHSFAAGPVEARAYSELGFHLSLGPSLLKRSSKNFDQLKAAVLQGSPSVFVFETDAPDQSGKPGSLAHPKRLLEIAGAFAAIKGGTATEHLIASTERLTTLFG